MRRGMAKSMTGHNMSMVVDAIEIEIMRSNVVRSSWIELCHNCGLRPPKFSALRHSLSIGPNRINLDQDSYCMCSVCLQPWCWLASNDRTQAKIGNLERAFDSCSI